MYAGLIAAYIPPLGGTRFSLNGADLWKSPDGLTWQPDYYNGFGDDYITSFEAFTISKNCMCLVARAPIPLSAGWGALKFSGASAGIRQLKGGLRGVHEWRRDTGAEKLPLKLFYERDKKDLSCNAD